MQDLQERIRVYYDAAKISFSVLKRIDMPETWDALIQRGVLQDTPQLGSVYRLFEGTSEELVAGAPPLREARYCERCQHLERELNELRNQYTSEVEGLKADLEASRQREAALGKGILDLDRCWVIMMHQAQQERGLQPGTSNTPEPTIELARALAAAAHEQSPAAGCYSSSVHSAQAPAPPLASADVVAAETATKEARPRSADLGLAADNADRPSDERPSSAGLDATINTSDMNRSPSAGPDATNAASGPWPVGEAMDGSRAGRHHAAEGASDPSIAAVDGAADAKTLVVAGCPGGWLGDRPHVHGNIESWGVEQVCGWVEAIELSQYSASMRENSIDGMMLLQLSEDDLVEIGVVNKFHRRKLSQKRAELAAAPRQLDSQARTGLIQDGGFGDVEEERTEVEEEFERSIARVEREWLKGQPRDRLRRQDQYFKTMNKRMESAEYARPSSAQLADAGSKLPAQNGGTRPASAPSSRQPRTKLRPQSAPPMAYRPLPSGGWEQMKNFYVLVEDESESVSVGARNCQFLAPQVLLSTPDDHVINQ